MNSKGMSKKVVVALVVIALVLASVSIILNALDLNNNISTSPRTTEDSSGGRIGIEIIPPIVEDKGIENDWK